MKVLQEKLDFLLDKYSVGKKAVLKDRNTVTVDGKEIPLLAHRAERRFIELRNIAHNGTLTGISVMRSARIVQKGECLNAALYRELDICAFVLQEGFVSIFSIANGNTMNTIAKTESGIVCTIEISAAMGAGQLVVDKHEIISQRGTACDKVVDTQNMQSSIYVFGKSEQQYTDVDFELYGLEIPDVAVVRQAFAVASKNIADELVAADKLACEWVAKSDESLKTCRKVGA